MSELLKKIHNYASEHDMLPDAGLMLACVSGGADSMCLLEALLDMLDTYKFTVGAAHFNHKLRGAESDRDEAFVREHCAGRGVHFFAGSGDVRAYAKEHGTGIEEAAREMRYQFFYKTAERAGAERIATAHTADDNAETMILNLARGTGTNGLSGIPPVRENVIRPMLRVTREEVVRFLAERRIPYVEDSTNRLDIYARNKVRNSVIPILTEINPRFNEAAAVAAELARADEEFISDIADLFITECCVGLTAIAEDLAVLPISVSGRVIRKLCGRGITYKHVKAVLDLCAMENPSAGVSLPGMTAHREYERIVFVPDQGPADEGFAPVCPTDGESAIILGLGLKMSCKSVLCNDKMIQALGQPVIAAHEPQSPEAGAENKINKSFTSFLFKSVDICGKMSVRPRREGDSIKLAGQNVTKTLKKLFIERRIPVRKRKLIPVIADDEGVLAVYGIGMGDRAAPQSGDLAWKIDFTSEKQSTDDE